ncbi:CLUMA_CG010160, isoform A [Clunio marinus]|uniref:CLUMA_CG010160, isoform A n=1 Tax=Clunio marinus TaxID=568069 RepID=A0A1J1I8Z7_9DIPT|nr:CLUMA_CG010160, isoform A [Clunio marinus]
MKTLILISLLVVTISALPSTRNNRIWNGENATPGQAPYLIGILWYEFATTIQPLNICGGAIVNVWWTITAAHCLINNLTGIGRFEIVVGQHFVSIANRSGREQFRNIAVEFIHPNFAGGASAYDVALMRLDAPLAPFNEFVQPIALQAQSAPPLQSGTVRSFGWGSVTGGPPHVLADELQTVQLPIMSSELCREVLSTILPSNPFSSSCMCTVRFENSGNVCNADSGGPAVANLNGQNVLVGVLAWGTSCTLSGFPTVWSAIGPVRTWIDQTIQANS